MLHDDRPTALKLWIVLNRAQRSIGRRLERQVEAHSLSFTEFAVLEVLLHRGRQPIGGIGNRVLLASGSMTYVIDKLTARGLLERQTCDTDRRVVYAALTPAGRALVEAVFDEHAALLTRLTAGLTPAEQRAVTDLLKRLGRAAEIASDASATAAPSPAAPEAAPAGAHAASAALEASRAG